MESNAWTSKADAAKGSATILPRGESILQPGQPGTWVLPAQQQRSLLLFLKAQPQVLGVAQILIGLMILCLGMTVAHFLPPIYAIGIFCIIKSGYHFWGSFFFFTSGVLSIAAGRKMTKRLIQGSLGTNTVSAIIAVFGSFMLIFEEISIFTRIIWMPSNVFFWGGLVAGVLILCLLEACIALSLSIFGCRAACSINKVLVYLPKNDNILSEDSVEHIYDDVAFQ